jgi:hypothetical protein
MIQLDLVPSADTPFFTHETTLDGRDYVFNFAWNSRRSVWALSMHTKAGETLFLSQALRHGRNLLSKCLSSAAPKGALFVWCNTPHNLSPPGVDELGGRAGIYYATEDELS